MIRQLRKNSKASKLNTVTVLAEESSTKSKVSVKDEDVKLVDLHSLADADTITGRLNTQLLLLE